MLCCVYFVSELFRIKAESAKDGLNYTIDISLLEVYCDEIRDLLTKEAAKKLEVKQTKDGTHVPDLTRRTVQSYEEVVTAIEEGQTIRCVHLYFYAAVSFRVVVFL